MSMAMAVNESPNTYHQSANRPQTSTSPRLVEPSITSTNKNYALVMHLWPVASFIIGPFAFVIPFALWMARKDESPFEDDHGREIINFMISMPVLGIVLAITGIGIILVPVLAVVALIAVIRGAVAAGNGEYFRYPLTIRFLS